MYVRVGFMFWQMLPSISLYIRLIFRRFWPTFIILPQIYYVMNKCLMMFNVRYSFESYFFHHWAKLNMFMINLLYYKHWTDKWKYIPYISVTHKVLKSCRSKMATLAHDVCDVHGASSLYIKTCWQSLYRVFPTGGMGESPHQPKICSFTPSPPNFYSLPPKVNSIQ